MVDCTVYNEDKTESYPIIANKCGDDYIATKHLDGYAVEQRARFSYTVFEFVDSNDGDENQTLQGGLLFWHFIFLLNKKVNCAVKCNITVCHKNDLNYASCVAPCPTHMNLG